ncbi:MAG: zinc metallopeptidase [Thermoleophilia bacterium]|nr:zinc metallopeptidase [Thermoleophilia bacterium]
MFFYGANPIFYTSLLLLVPAIILAIYAQYKVSSTYKKFSKKPASSGVTGAEASRRLLDEAGLGDVDIEVIPGQLSDHYDPRRRVLRLSEGVARGSSLAALGVAAHESGHAIQHASKYVPMQIRSAVVPAASFGSNFGPLIFFMGLIFTAFRPLMTLGIVLFTAAVLFQIVTLPVEFNASSRAMKLLQRNGLVVGSEAQGAGQVLRAAALTYVAAALMSILMLVRMVLISRSR